VWRFTGFFVLITALIACAPLALARSGNPILQARLWDCWSARLDNPVRDWPDSVWKVFDWFVLAAPLGLFWPLFMLRWLFGAERGDPHWMAP
jgi:hypothetical protein